MDKQEYTITLYTENAIGVIGKIASIISRRKINIESLNTSPSEIQGIHRFTIVIEETEEVLRKLCRQFEKQVDILSAYFSTDAEVIWQEQALYKVPADVVNEKVYVERLLRQYGAKVVAIRTDYIVFETAGHRLEIDKLTEELTKYGLIEFVRGARIAIIKDSSGLHNKLMELEINDPAGKIIGNASLNKKDVVFSL